MDSKIDDVEHLNHHEFLRECIPLLREYLENQRQSQERWEKFRSSFIGAVASGIGIGLISFLAWIGGLVLEAIRNGGH